MWDELVDDYSECSVSCDGCDYVDAAVGKREISLLMKDADAHSRTGADHNVKIDLKV
jgi:hypothetical protein